MHNMTHNPITPVNARYGAPMGRASLPLDPSQGKISLRRVRINSQGYDAGGAYWGIGQALWVAMDQAGATHYFRAPNRDKAKAALCEMVPGIVFYR